MKEKLNLEIITAIAVSLICAILILNEIPIHYLAGFLLIAVTAIIFIMKPLYFLIGLFLLRSIFDNFLRSIRVAPGGIDIGLGGVVALALVAGTIFYILTHSKNLGRLQQAIVGLYLIFCLVSTASFFISPDKLGSAKVLVRRFSVFSILLLTMMNIRSENNARILLKAIILSAIIPLAVGVVKYVMEGWRFTGTFGHPNVIAFYLLIIIGCVLTQVDCPHRHFSLSFSRKFYLGVLAAALLLTLTRSAWASGCLMVGIYAFFFNRRLIIPAFCVLVGIAFLPIVQERVLDTFNVSAGSIAVDGMSSLGWRFRTWYYLFSEGMKRPFIGYGINATAHISTFPHEAHNDYLRFFVESGIPGVVVYYASYAYLLVFALKRYNLCRENDYLKKLSLFFVCFVPAFLLMSGSENLGRYLTVLWYFWGLVGIYFGLVALKREQ